MGNTTLDALIAYIHEQGPYVLAAPEDADFFRNAKRKLEKAPAPPPAPAKPFIPPAPPPKIEAPKPQIQPLKEEPLPKVSFEISSVKNTLSIVAPELAILSEIPSDLMAKKIAERWKTKNQSAPISILVYQEPPEQRLFLEQIVKAIDVYFGPAKIVQAEGIEKEKQWGAFLSVQDLKMIVVCDYTLWQLSHLMQFYKEVPAQAVRTLGNVPLFLLPDLSLYLKDAALKRSLWKALCHKLS